MARGWESKAVEAQQDEARQPRPKTVPVAPDELARRDRLRALELTRKRAADDLARASAPAHRRMLEQAIADLDERLAAMRRE